MKSILTVILIIVSIFIIGSYVGVLPKSVSNIWDSFLNIKHPMELSKLKGLEKKIYLDLAKLKKTQGLPREFFNHKKIQIMPQSTCANISKEIFKNIFTIETVGNTYMLITLMPVPEDQTKIENGGVGKESKAAADLSEKKESGGVVPTGDVGDLAKDSCLISFEIFDLKSDNKLFEINRHYRP